MATPEDSRPVNEVLADQVKELEDDSLAVRKIVEILLVSVAEMKQQIGNLETLLGDMQPGGPMSPSTAGGSKATRAGKSENLVEHELWRKSRAGCYKTRSRSPSGHGDGGKRPWKPPFESIEIRGHLPNRPTEPLGYEFNCETRTWTVHNYRAGTWYVTGEPPIIGSVAKGGGCEFQDVSGGL